MPDSSRGAEYSIAAVSKLTGIGCHALRVWERRYGYPVPCRSGSGHRRYREDQVGILRRVAELVRSGRAIGEVMDAARAGRLDQSLPSEPAEAPPASRLVERLLAGDLDGASAEYDRVAAGRDLPGVMERLLEPALVETGEIWFRGACDVAQEHVASGFLRQKLVGLLDIARRGNPGPVRSAVVGTVQGDRHEGGALIISVLLELAGWRAIYLGTDLPVADYQRAIDRWRPTAVALSFVLSRNINKRFEELARLRGAPVFVGGRGILNYQGLARRHGLIPVPGPAAPACERLRAQAERRAGRAAAD